MIEIVFSNSAKGSLMQGKSRLGTPDRRDICAFELALSVGDISEDIPGPKRLAVPESFYDHVLQWALGRQPEEFSVGHLLAEALSRQLGIGDGWLALRAEKLIEEGLLTVVKEAPPEDIRYRRIVRKA